MHKSSNSGSPDTSLPTEKDNNQSRSLEVSPTSKLGDVTIDTNQQRTVGMFKKSSNFADLNQENPFVKFASNPCGGR